MKVAVSYISSKYNLKETIKKINISSADYIHMDIMDGKYVENKNFNRFTIKKILKLSKKKIDVHLMVNRPEKFLKFFKKFHFVKNIYFHPSSTKNSAKLIEKIKSMGISPGIVINPDENIEAFINLYKDIDRVLIMSVKPGSGGQKFINKTINKIEDLGLFMKKNKHIFDIAVDGGINDVTIKKLHNLKVDYVISGSYICKSDDYETMIMTLKND